MDKFWQFARMLLHYRGLLVLAGVGVLLDTACVIGGFGTLGAIIQQFFGEERVTIHQVVARELLELRDKKDAWFSPDLTGLERLVPEGPIAGLAFALGMILVFALVGSAGRFI